ncbi:TPA: hypothetical protein DEO28_03630 [Candidatus Dependentiae bacterium]|nr:MAG: hypothetical protein UR14_C0007G0027 [candidate division TM6 bacterium GW2011_GWE2_31_21]KKP53612.1 MAG: hypothetical protein UR43_C0004G0153 [candidate division TM6 bacterium GW2011_GWF2_33_332]HBS48148.1 hypothetical protein [Candidatus Dependentiae bacterium]HBZ73572.1 hypothetical protein [Candidatus Dependentiae bacterium]
MFNFDYLALMIYSFGFVGWIFVWKSIIGFDYLKICPLLKLPFYAGIFAFISNVGFCFFYVIENYEAELKLYDYVEVNGRQIAMLSLAIAVFVILQAKFINKNDSSRMFLKLIFASFLFTILGVFPLYWMPSKSGWITFLRHEKTVFYFYSLFILASGIIFLLYDLKILSKRELKKRI